MLLKFLPRQRCLMDRFLDSHSSRVDRSESRPEGKTAARRKGQILQVEACWVVPERVEGQVCRSQSHLVVREDTAH